jgi:hypothetical protein
VLKEYSTHAAGLSLGVMDGHIDPGTTNVQAAFSAIGVAVPIVAVQTYEYINDNYNSHPFLIVLSPIH